MGVQNVGGGGEGGKVLGKNVLKKTWKKRKNYGFLHNSINHSEAREGL